MIKVEAFFGLVTLALWVYSLVDVVGKDESRMRHLPKLWWLLLVLFFPLAGSIAWLFAGRPQGHGPRPRDYEREVPHFPEDDRPGRSAAVDPRQGEDFLREVRERAEEQRRQYREQQKADPEA